MRIVSLLPSATEIVCSLGLEAHLVRVTHECDHYFSRPGPRLVDSLEILAHTLHPDLHPLPEGLPPALRVEHAGEDSLRRISEEIT